jgi:hypothetical protein
MMPQRRWAQAAGQIGLIADVWMLDVCIVWKMVHRDVYARVCAPVVKYINIPNHTRSGLASIVW